MENTIAMLGGMFALLVTAVIIFSIFWIWMLIECIHNEEIKGTEKAFFLLLIILLNWVGGAIYCFSASRKERFGCFSIMVIITASFVGFLSLYGAIKLINENKHPALVNAREIINNLIDNGITFPGTKENDSENIDAIKNTITQSPKQQKYNISTKNNNTNIKNVVTVKKEKFILLNKSDENRRPAQTPKEIANINTSKYSENLNSWIDSNGKVHFSNTSLQPATE